MFLFTHKKHVKWIKTWLFNVKAFGFSKGKVMPIFLYDVEVYSMPQIIINAPFERGMIEIGKPAKKSFGKTKISGSGKLIFAGRSIIWEGCHIEVYGKLDIRENVLIGVDVSIFCFNEIVMKANSRIGFDSVMMDSDFHYVLNMQSGVVANNKAPIILEESAWVGSHCRLCKNTHIPSYSIVASNSLVNRDFKTEPSFTFFGGGTGKTYPLWDNKNF